MSEYCKNCYELQEQLDQLKADRGEALKQLEFVRTLNTVKGTEIRKLSKTLAKIKEIAENMNKECFYDDFDCMNCDMQNGCTYFNKKQILQKISECEVEDAR